MYQLKNNQEGFTVTDGPFAGQSFKRGRLYREIPPSEAHRFVDLSAVTSGGQNSETNKTGTARKRERKIMFPKNKEE